MPRLVESFRSGRGIPFADYGPDMIEGQAASTRPVYSAELARWFAAIPDVAARLAGESARILDIGCGEGWSSVTMARAFPNARIEGVDLDPASIAAATATAEREGVADRVSFEVRDAASLAGAGFDVATMFEMLHDLSHPVEVAPGRPRGTRARRASSSWPTRSPKTRSPARPARAIGAITAGACSTASRRA